jgi:hypothetical protein
MTSVDNEKQPPAAEPLSTPISEDQANDGHSSDDKPSIKADGEDQSNEEAKKEAKGSFKDFIVGWTG